MPTLLNLNGFKFFFYANEHEPMHIHVMRADGFAKIELENLIKENQEDFERAWNEWFN